MSRRASRPSISIFEDRALKAQADNAMMLINQQRRASYMQNERVIVEETENSDSSSSLKSKPPTSNSDSDSNSSYDIFERKNNKLLPNRNQLGPQIIINSLNSSKNIEKKSSKSESKSSNTISRDKSSDSSSSSSSESSATKGGPRKTVFDPAILAKLDPRLIDPSYLIKQSSDDPRGSSSKSKSSVSMEQEGTRPKPNKIPK